MWWLGAWPGHILEQTLLSSAHPDLRFLAYVPVVSVTWGTGDVVADAVASGIAIADNAVVAVDNYVAVVADTGVVFDFVVVACDAAVVDDIVVAEDVVAADVAGLQSFSLS